MTPQEQELLERYLDGELPREALPESVRSQAEAFARLFSAPGRGAELPPWVRQRIMQRVRALAGSPWRRAAAWLVAPRPLRLSPLAGLAAAAAAVALVILVRPRTSPPADEDGVVVRFVYAAPQASRVAVTGSFTNWDSEGVPLRRGADGTWVAELRLVPGLHHYVFVVDGSQWEPDPNAASRVQDGFGSENSVLLVPGRRSS
jgi:hypothetical protein